MEFDMDKEGVQQLKSERYARQLVRNAFPIDVDVEEYEYAQDIYERLKADLKLLFNEVPSPAKESDLCPLCGRKGVASAVEPHARLGEAQIWCRNWNVEDRDFNK